MLTSGAQNNAHAGISVNGGSPTITAVTTSANPWGLVLQGSGSPNVTNSTISSNTAGGIWVAAPSTLSLSTVTISNNMGYAISQEAKITFGTVSGLTVTGNTHNAVEIRPSTADINTTWKNIGLPYVVTGANIRVSRVTPPAPVLTIEPGVTVRFNAATNIWVGPNAPGELQAVGTTGQPILFTANTATPTPGFWHGVQFYAYATPTSRIAYATIRYAGATSNWGGISVYGSSPIIQNVITQNNAHSGISVNGGSPAITAVTASANPWGLVFQGSGSPNVTNSTISGNTTGGVWMAAPSTPRIFNSVFSGSPSGVVNSTPSGTLVTAHLNYWSAATGPSGVGPGSGQSVSAGVRYEPWLTQSPSFPQYLTSAEITSRKFNPSAGDTVNWNVASSQTGNWTLTISDSASVVVRTLTASGATAVFSWDGKNSAGVDQPDGAYSYLFQTTTGGGDSAAPARGSTFVDRTLDVRIISPAADQVLSNVYQGGSASVIVTGTVTMANLTSWTLSYGSGPSPTVWTSINSGTSPVSSGPLGTWSTLGLTNGVWTLRVQAFDSYGNGYTTTRSVAVGNFHITQNALEFNGAAGGTVNYSSTLPFDLTESLLIKNQAGATVRTIFYDQPRPAGTYVDSWDGRDDLGNLLPDGPYFYIAVATAGTDVMTWDLTYQYLNDGYVGRFTPTGSTFDPFKNQPLVFTYTLDRPGRVYALFSPNGGSGCTPPPRFCILNNEYQRSGTHTVSWAGVNEQGAYIAQPSDILGFTPKLTVDSFHTSFSKNAVVLFGTKPVVTGVTVTPPVFSPWSGSQTLTLNFSTYASQPATIIISFLNQESFSTLQAIALTDQAPGLVTVPWDGRANNGMLVAPGHYTVTVSVSDSIGNTVFSRTISTVQY